MPWREALAVTALVAIVYAPAVRFDFVNWDDPRYVSGDPHVRAGLTAETMRWAFGRTHDNWHPLTSLSHVAVWQLFGAAPGPHHAVNVALHAAAAGFVVLALSALTAAPLRAVTVALLFGLHPLRVESVAWVSERKDVLSALFFVLALWAYALWVRRPSRWSRTALLAAFVAAVLAKPMVVTLPVVLLVLDWWPLRRTETWFRLLVEKLPLFAIAAVGAGVTVLVQRTGGSMSTLTSLPFDDRLANAAVASWRYLADTIWPAHLAFFYPLRAWAPTVVAAAVVGLVAVTGEAWRHRERRPYLLAGWLWWLVMLLPVSGVFQVGEQAMADRFTYLPSLGLGMAVVWLVADLAGERSRERLATAAAALAILACAWATHRQLPTWRNSETLTRHALAVTAGNYMAHLNLGRALVERGDFAGGRAEYAAAAAIRPDHPLALTNLGHAELRDGQPDRAEALFRRALAVRPAHGDALNGLGLVAAARGDHAAAIAFYEEALAANPGLGFVRGNLAASLAATGRTDEAIAEYALVLSADPTLGFELGNVLFQAGRSDEAIAAWRTALVARPDWHDARDNVAVALLALGRPAEAIPELERILAADPSHARAARHLGLALKAVGRRGEAIAALRRALAAEPGDPEARRALADLGGVVE